MVEERVPPAALGTPHARGSMRFLDAYFAEVKHGRPWRPLPNGHDRETRAFLAALFGSYRRGRRIRRQENKALRAQEAAHG